MRRIFQIIILLFPIMLFGQHNKQAWKSIDSLNAIKNYQQTIPLLEEIKLDAKNSNNSPEWIKAVIAQLNTIGLNNSNDDKIFLKIEHFENNIANANELQKSALYSFYAQYLLSIQYYKIVNDQKSFLTLSRDDKQIYIDSIFILSIQTQEELVKENIENWKILINKESFLSLSPTLYHLLAHHYLDYLYQNTITNKTKIDELKNSLRNINTANNFKEAKAYLAFNDVLMNNYNLSNNEQRIDSIAKTTDAQYNAFAYLQLANSYQYENYTKTIKYSNIALDNYPNSPWQNDLENLKRNITKTEIDISHKKFVPSKEYIPFKINHRNADKIYIRLYDLTNNPKHQKDYSLKFDSLTTQVSIDAKLVYEEEVTLKSFDDYQSHSTNYKINPLNYGNYKIVVANNAAFKDDNLYNDVVSSNLIVSDLFITATSQEIYETGYNYNILLVDRKTGLPYADEKVELYNSLENEKYSRYKSLKTSKIGELNYFYGDEEEKDLDDLYLFIPKENQFIDFNDLDNIADHTNEEITDDIDQKTALILTDRSIYRPGQEIFFKAIIHNQNYKEGKVIPNQKTTIYLKDANRQQIDSLELVTNEFGSVNGKFIIPNKTLNGRFAIVASLYEGEIGSQYFRVEEYKRPTFKVEFETNKETYTKKDTAEFIGTATSLSGALLSGAFVKYTVHYTDQDNWANATLLDSNTTTDKDGKFKISFCLANDALKNKENIYFNIKAQVTNQNSEIQDANTNYNYSTKPWKINVGYRYSYSKNDWKEIKIETLNGNNQHLPLSGKLEIYKIEELKIIKGTSAIFDFEAEYHLLENKKYKEYFSNYFDDSYLKSNNKTLVKTYNFDTNSSDHVKIDSSIFKIGEYEVNATSIQRNDTIKATANVTIYQKNSTRFSHNQLLYLTTANKSYAQGDKLVINFGSNQKNLKKIFIHRINGYKKSPLEILNVHDGKGEYVYRLQNEDVESGFLRIEYFSILNNILFKDELIIRIKSSNKILSIKTLTFRDKITSGKPEKWSFTIKNNDTTAQAELLASMYDSALDKFTNHDYIKNFDVKHPDYNRFSLSYLEKEFENYAYLKNLSNKNYAISLYNKKPNLFVNNIAFLSDYTIFNSFSSKKIFTGSVRGISTISSTNTPNPLYVVDGEILDNFSKESIPQNEIFEISILKDDIAKSLYGTRAANGAIVIKTKSGANKNKVLTQAQIRTNLKETAFFYPNLYTDQEGNISFEFESPEALTRWKVLLFAHTKDLGAGSATFFTQTQKQLMVRPNIPRYLREGDEIELKTQIQNLSDSVQKGTARIELIDPKTNQIINPDFGITSEDQSFEVNAKDNVSVSWQLKIPSAYQQVQIKIIAANEEHSDGESHELYILPNKEFVTETQKIVLHTNQKATYIIKAEGKENSHATISIQSNPILEIISALDYLKDYPYECTEQTSSKWFAFSILKYINNKYPQIATYFKSLNDSSASSKLSENITAASSFSKEEMPWLQNIISDEQRLKNIAFLFETNNIDSEIKSLETKLQKSANKDGSMPWFEGSKPNLMISARILEIVDKVKTLDSQLISADMLKIAQNIINYLDEQIDKELKANNYNQVVDISYARLYFKEVALKDSISIRLKDFMKSSPMQSAKLPAGLAAKSLLVNQYLNLEQESKAIYNRLNQEYVLDNDKGKYWESNGNYHNAISLQAYLVETYKKMNPTSLSAMGDWIYYNKQANHWQNTWTTVDAIYSLLLIDNPADFVVDNQLNIVINNQKVTTSKNNLGQESISYETKYLKNNLAIEVENKNPRKVFGHVIHGYFEKLSTIKSTQKEISVSKKLLVLKNGIWKESNVIQAGDKVKVQLTIVNNEDINFVHLKDSRAVGFEPIYQPSGYQFRGGYYFTIKDASTNYFFDTLRKGTHVFEYELKTNNTGTFNSGIATIECMYNATIKSNSENLKIEIID